MLQAQATTTSAPVAMPQFQRTIAENDLRVTPAARAKMSELLADEEDVNAIRVFVSGGGCGGMTYGMTFTDSATEIRLRYRRRRLRVVHRHRGLEFHARCGNRFRRASHRRQLRVQ